MAENHPIRQLEIAVDLSKQKLSKIKDTFVTVDKMNDEEKKLAYLQQENKHLRLELKVMNDNLNKLIDIVKDINIKRQKYRKETNERPTSHRIKAKNQELVNSDKQLHNLETEHTRLTKRLEEINSANYLINLK